MTQEAGVERIKLLRGHRWPKDRHGSELDVDDLILFINYSHYAIPAFGRVIRVGRTGKVHVETIRVLPGDEVREIEIKCGTATKLSENMIRAITLEKLALPS